MFLSNKYTRWYTEIVTKAKALNRKKVVGSEYFERHHIVPKSLGGSNEKDNLVLLTAREHFVAHWLLTKMVDGAARKKMQIALVRMMHNSDTKLKTHQFAKHQYEAARRANAEARKGNTYARGYKHTPEARAKLSQLARNREVNAFSGRKHSEETRRLISERRKGKNMGNTNTLGRKLSDEHKAKISTSLKLRSESCVV